MNPVDADTGDGEPPVGEKHLRQWRELLTRLNVTLQEPHASGLETSIRGIASDLAALVQADPDMAQALLVHPELCEPYPYSVAHSAHVAATWALLALRQDGAAPESLTVPLCAALTMNLAMLSLQDRLADQEAPPKPAQRDLLREHPVQSAAMLRHSGITEPLWLAMVEQHHEEPGGGGYPARLPEPLPEAQRLRMIDVYCACFGSRARRHPMLPDLAARRLFQQHATDPTALALAKEFGLYPPGTVVRLASLELALVVRRGAAANAPIAIALQNPNGEPRATPAQRDTSQPAFAVVAAVTPALLRVRIPWVQLFTLY
ncbi:HD domain-containing phosphohydrolase [Ideonella sp.]|uniref:HD-GYP domain-containing protein n=1 Tax=Ideonella sp. TaxID=1929293 RepID=UPI002B45C0D1|nr:HD domain-containing phosphohydrolase [Ideonella sp.]HJV67827.1 HD domain-containing phosphohydrolase [Ideonella sp.]